jgi:hypothetical protein
MPRRWIVFDIGECRLKGHDIQALVCLGVSSDALELE